MAYTQARQSKSKGVRYVGYYIGADGKPKVAGTFSEKERALHVAEEEEQHVREARDGTSPAVKARMSIEAFGKTRSIPRIDITPKSKQTYRSHLKNHVYPYLGMLPVSEISRETIYNHLVTTLDE